MNREKTMNTTDTAAIMQMAEEHIIHTYNRYPIVLDHGEGVYLYDTEGKKYLDLNSGQFCVALGHSNDKILSKIFEKSYNVVHTASNIYTDEVAECSNQI